MTAPRLSAYDRICQDVTRALDAEQVKGIREDLAEWTDASRSQSIEAIEPVDEEPWSGVQYSINLMDEDRDNNFSPAMATGFTLATKDSAVSITLVAVEGSDAYTREIGKVAEFMVTSAKSIPRIMAEALSQRPRLGDIVALPDDFADYADLEVVIISHDQTNNGDAICGVFAVQDLGTK